MDEEIVIDMKNKSVTLGEVTIDIINQRITIGGVADSVVVDENETVVREHERPMPVLEEGQPQRRIPAPIDIVARSSRRGEDLEAYEMRRQAWVGRTVIVHEDDQLPVLNNSRWLVTKHIRGSLYRGTLVDCPPAHGRKAGVLGDWDWNGTRATALLRHKNEEAHWQLHHDRLTQEDFDALGLEITEEEETDDQGGVRGRAIHKSCSICNLDGVNRRTCQSIKSGDEWLQVHKVMKSDGSVWMLYDGRAELVETGIERRERLRQMEEGGKNI